MINRKAIGNQEHYDDFIKVKDTRKNKIREMMQRRLSCGILKIESKIQNKKVKI